MDVGFIGLGRMGLGMARNIIGAGHRVRAWNRSPVDAARTRGIDIVGSPEEALRTDVVFTMLSDDAAVRDVLLVPDLLAGARRGLVHVVTATISVAFADELAAAHAARSVGYVSAPVFGRPDVAEAGQLNVVAAGKPEALDRVQPLLDAIGRRTFRMGDEPRHANAAKIAGNMMIAMAIEALAEAVLVTEPHGVTPAAFLDLMVNTLFGCRAYENYGGKIVGGDYDAGFRLALGLKDLRLATAAAETAGRPTPMLDAVRDQMQATDAAGMGDRDWSAIAAYTLGR